MSSDSPIELVKVEPMEIVGVSLRTSITEGAQACPRFWSEVFGPRMQELPTYAGHAYGVAIMLDDDTCDYWAGLAYYKGQMVPEGMSTLKLGGGLYAACRLPGLPGLALSHKYLYHAWGLGQDYELVLDQPCYEQYPSDHMQTGMLDFFMPIRASQGDHDDR